MQFNDRIVREKEAEFLTGLKRTTRWKLEREGKFPARVRLTGTAYGWRLSEIRAWMESLKVA